MNESEDITPASIVDLIPPPPHLHLPTKIQIWHACVDFTSVARKNKEDLIHTQSIWRQAAQSCTKRSPSNLFLRANRNTVPTMTTTISHWQRFTAVAMRQYNVLAVDSYDCCNSLFSVSTSLSFVIALNSSTDNGDRVDRNAVLYCCVEFDNAFSPFFSPTFINHTIGHNRRPLFIKKNNGWWVWWKLEKMMTTMHYQIQYNNTKLLCGRCDAAFLSTLLVSSVDCLSYHSSKFFHVS